MEKQLLEQIADLLLNVKSATGKRTGCEPRLEILGEVYLQVLAAVSRQSARSRIVCLEAFVRSIARMEHRRVHWREQKQAEQHCPTYDNADSNLESAVAIDRLGHSPSRCPLDELVHRDDCQSLVAVLAKLPEADQHLLWSLTDETKSLSIRELARRTGSSVRTLQRRRKVLCDRLRRELDS